MKKLKNCLRFKFINALPFFCINCGDYFPVIPKPVEQKCTQCGYSHFPGLIFRGETFKVFYGGYIGYFVLKCMKFVYQNIPKFKIYTMNNFIFLDINNYSMREKCFGNPYDICECRIYTISFRLLGVYKQYIFGKHWCNMCYYPNNKFLKEQTK